MLVDLTREEIEIIKFAISVAQQECQLPEAEEDAELKTLFDKLGV